MAYSAQGGTMATLQEGEISTLQREIAAYERNRAMIETEYFGKWVVVRDEEIVGIYESFEDAAHDAAGRFGRGPYLIRQAGASPMTLPASVMYE